MEDNQVIPFSLETAYTPTGDQPTAIDALVDNIQAGVPSQVLLGVTGSGKTFTMVSSSELVMQG